MVKKGEMLIIREVINLFIVTTAKMQGEEAQPATKLSPVPQHCLAEFA